MHADALHRPQATAARRLFLLIEFLALFVGVPTLLAYRLVPVHIILFLLIATLGCLIALLCDRSFPSRRFWDGARFLPRLTVVVVTFVAAGAVITVLSWAFLGDHFLSLVRERPRLWRLIMILYPLLSVYPQEIIFRAFLFHRYRAVFREPWTMVCASALVFGFVHVYFWNELAVGLSLLGGLLFAWTYERTESLLITAIEHALYGCLIFTVGLGGFFFHGTADAVRRLAG